MSFIDRNTLQAKCKNQFQELAMERPDDCILSDSDVYQLKGGDKIFALKLLSGLGSVAGFLALTGRFKQLRTFEITGSTLFWSNVAMISTMSAVQLLYLKQSGLYERYKLHQNAFFSRFIDNQNHVNMYRKAPKYH